MAEFGKTDAYNDQGVFLACWIAEYRAWRELTRKRRGEILKRDNYRCLVCGHKGRLDIAHIIGLYMSYPSYKNWKGVWKKGKEMASNLIEEKMGELEKYFDDDNLLTLCRKCHNKLDSPLKCPVCKRTSSFYERKTKKPRCRCKNCKAEFDDPIKFTPEEKVKMFVRKWLKDRYGSYYRKELKRRYGKFIYSENSKKF